MHPPLRLLARCLLAVADIELDSGAAATSGGHQRYEVLRECRYPEQCKALGHRRGAAA